jgi:hypothetical protein
MKNKKARSLTALSLGLGLAILGVWAISSNSLTVGAAPPAELRVCPTDCTYSSIQDAVDAASDGDTIKVAAGTYDTVVTLGTYTQVVLVYKSVTIQGGYTTAFTEPPDPAGNPTILDAQGKGRVIVAFGEGTPITPTIAGLHITGGDASGSRGGIGGHDAGGGVYVLQAAVTISDCTIYGNTASTVDWGYGGGVYVFQTLASTLTHNTISGNTASTASGIEDRGAGGGICVFSGQATLSGNTVQGNTASTGEQGYGGGITLGGGSFALIDNTIENNTASTAGEGFGGGIMLETGDVTLEANTVQLNVASTITNGQGGGLALWYGNAALSSNAILGNTATLNAGALGQGGGLLLAVGSLTLTNNIVADNHANTQGSGLWIGGSEGYPSDGRLLHTTIADNRGDVPGIYVDGYTTLAFTNTIIAGHTMAGIAAAASSTVTLETTLWHGNGAWILWPSKVTTSNDVTGDPAFRDPSGWDYHLGADSAAVDRGVDAGVDIDIDGDQRPMDGDCDGTAAVDIGADESWCHIHFPLVLRQFP